MFRGGVQIFGKKHLEKRFGGIFGGIGGINFYCIATVSFI